MGDDQEGQGLGHDAACRRPDQAGEGGDNWARCRPEKRRDLFPGKRGAGQMCEASRQLFERSRGQQQPTKAHRQCGRRRFSAQEGRRQAQ
jgi:hypothetical protein